MRRLAAALWLIGCGGSVEEAAEEPVGPAQDAAVCPATPGAVLDAGAAGDPAGGPTGWIEPDGGGQGVVAVLMVDLGGKALTTTAKTPGRLRVIEDHDGTLAGLAARPIALDSDVGIGVRGNFTAGLAKKQYSL